jgi:predicted N-acetyltransferase YhbS
MHTSTPTVVYLPDSSIDDDLDRELRGLLSTCFLKPQDYVFRERRYFREPYPHRWVIRDSGGVLIAHMGVHVKHVEADGLHYPIGGICEVCVHPAFRGRGYVGRMLECIHAWLVEEDFVFSVLFGSPDVYGSSGYVHVDNLVHGGEDGKWPPVGALVRTLTATPWPTGDVRLPGPKF